MLEADEISNKSVKLSPNEIWSRLRGLAEIHFMQDSQLFLLDQPNISVGRSQLPWSFWTDATWSLCRQITAPPWGGRQAHAPARAGSPWGMGPGSVLWEPHHHHGAAAPWEWIPRKSGMPSSHDTHTISPWVQAHQATIEPLQHPIWASFFLESRFWSVF